MRARYLNAFANWLDEQGVRADSVLADLRAPSAIRENDDRIVPIRLFEQFVSRGLSRAGTLQWGYLAASLELGSYGVFGQRVTSEANLFASMKAFCKLANSEYSEAAFYLREAPECVWFCRGPIAGDRAVAGQTELYVLAMMIDTVRISLGSSWSPRVARLQMTDSADVRSLPALTDAQLAFGGQALAIAVPKALIAGSIYGRAREEAGGPIDEATESLADPMLGSSIARLLEGWVTVEQPRIETVAESLGMSARSLQRALSEEGRPFRELLNEAQFRQGARLLADPDRTVTDIALELGYGETSGFSRAFARIAGMSPREYRRRVSTADGRSPSGGD